MADTIVVDRLGKRFSHYRADRPTTFQELFLSGLRKLRSTGQFWALRDVSFTVGEGKMLGVIGRNGAGKSTLLRLLGGVGRADTGMVRVRGRIGAYLDVRTGFHPVLTGRENIFVSGIVGGLSRREVAKRFDSIVAFAELDGFIDDQMRTYSTGMQMRLAFSVFVHSDPDVLLMDEVLAVGDHLFQSKCIDLITRFKAEGRTIVLVSHASDLVTDFCDEALWLRSGRVAALGEPESVVAQYLADEGATQPEPVAEGPSAGQPERRGEIVEAGEGGRIRAIGA
jgi:lipopolysaccharide transport system ATP-binding protein